MPGIVMAIHTFGEYLHFHPHLHVPVADGLFERSGLFYVLPDVSPKPLEELFRAHPVFEMARTHQESLGSRPAAGSEMPERNAYRFSHRRPRGDRAHPAPSGLLWKQGVRVLPARAPPEVAEWVIEPCHDDPFPDYDTEPVNLSSEALA
ncbi:MAG: transposase [Desulfosoma sp.]|uniref:transposase n=1 Tax=Desulfosoma sp. TaxID=2603217 RepID=UPI0040492963